MERFVKIAESILNLWKYEDYALDRVDIQYNTNSKEMVAYASYHSDLTNTAFEVKILADGSFTQI